MGLQLQNAVCALFCFPKVNSKMQYGLLLLFVSVGKISTQPHTLCTHFETRTLFTRLPFREKGKYGTGACIINVWGSGKIFP